MKGQFNATKIKVIREGLHKLRDERIFVRSSGICSNVIDATIYSGLATYHRHNIFNRFFTSTFPQWPLFSGDIEYPVPHETMTAVCAYRTLRDMWDKNTQYGRNRWDLLGFLIDVADELE